MVEGVFFGRWNRKRTVAGASRFLLSAGGDGGGQGLVLADRPSCSFVVGAAFRSPVIGSGSPHRHATVIFPVPLPLSLVCWHKSSRSFSSFPQTSPFPSSSVMPWASWVFHLQGGDTSSYRSSRLDPGRLPLMIYTSWSLKSHLV